LEAGSTHHAGRYRAVRGHTVKAGRVLAERGDASTADAFLRAHAIDGDLSEAALGGMLMLARGCLRLALGSARAALDDFEQLRARDERSGLDTPGIPLRAYRALAHLHLGERDVARALADEEYQRALRWDTPMARAIALRMRGLATGDADGIDLLRAAIAEAERSPARLEHAHSLTEYGAALRRAGHRRDARRPLREGLDLADRCGALRLARRARDELVAAGARPRRNALRGRDALTPSERRVAQLATEGLGNRDIAQALFVTVRTVEGHLTPTYSKLGITNRDELARAAHGVRGMTGGLARLSRPRMSVRTTAARRRHIVQSPVSPATRCGRRPCSRRRRSP
jgi:DNA-binding NarL/FixJ family response regulator